MNETIGLITLHASHNVGSALQTYAMQQILSDYYGFNVEIINYSAPGQKELYSIFHNNWTPKGIAKNILSGLFFLRLAKNKISYRDFSQSYFKLSSKSYGSIEKLAEISGKYRIIICGSDQIWNTKCPDYSDAYLIPFDDSAVKIAYAPSFGGNNPFDNNSNQIQAFQTHLSRFHKISAREENGCAWLARLTRRNMPIVPDPTLLTTNSLWDTIASKHMPPKGNYILFYGMPYDQRTLRLLKMASKQLRMRVIMMDPRAWLFSRAFTCGAKLFPHHGPTAFLSLIRSASYVITTSFHGSIFSCLYQRPFWTICSNKSNPSDDRIPFLLQQLGLKDRLYNLDQSRIEDLDKPICYKQYLETMPTLRSSGYGFLSDALNTNPRKPIS